MKAKMKFCLICLLAIVVLPVLPLGVQARSNVIENANYSELCKVAGEQYYICPEFLEAIVECQSLQGIGIMHVDPEKCYAEMSLLHVSEKDLSNPELNIQVGAAKLLNLFEECCDPDIVLSQYLSIEIDSHLIRSILDRSMQLEYEHSKLEY